MSKDVNRDKVLLTTRVRTPLKNDLSWIHKLKQEQEIQENPCCNDAAEAKPSPGRRNSYVLSTAKKFEQQEPAVDGESQPEESEASVDPLVQTVADTSAEKSNGSVDTSDAQRNLERNEEAAETSAENHAVSLQNDETQVVSEETPEAVSPVEAAEQPVSHTVSENPEGNADASIDQSYVEHHEAALINSADVAGEVIQNGETAPENTEAVSPVEPAAESKNECADTPVDQSNVQHNEEEASAGAQEETAAEGVTEESRSAGEISSEITNEHITESEHSTKSEAACVTNLENEGVESTAQPAEDPLEQSIDQTAEAVVEAVMESPPEAPAVTNISCPEEAPIQNSLEPDAVLSADTASELLTQPATESFVKCAEPAAPAEPGLNTTAQEESERDVQAADDTAAKQNVEPTPATAADPLVELNIEDALEPARASDAEAVLDPPLERAPEPADGSDVEAPTAEAAPEAVLDPPLERATGPADGPDVEAPTAEAAPEAVEDPKEPRSEQMTPNQSDDTNIDEMVQKPVEETLLTEKQTQTGNGIPVCSFCGQIIDGNVKISLSEPPVKLHADCLKCGVCAKALGDLMTPMFLHDLKIHCDRCFAVAVRA